MTSLLQGREVIDQQETRVYYQPGGPGPFNEVFIADPFINVGGLSEPLGDISHTRTHNPYRRGEYTSVAEVREEPGEITGTVTFHHAKGGIPRAQLRRGCQYNLYVAAGDCGDLLELDKAWTSWVRVLDGGRITESSYGDLTSTTGTDPLTIEASTNFRGLGYVGSLAFGNKFATEITTEALDAAYACNVNCSDCGVDNDGTKWAYVLCRPASTQKPYIVYTTDGGTTGTILSIAAAANDEVPSAIRIFGKYLIVISPTANTATNGGYYYSEINDFGVPAAFTKITTGFVNNFEPRDMFVAGPGKAFISADGGYIYELTNVLNGVTAIELAGATAEDLTRIHGQGDVMYAVGTDGAVIKSLNRGVTWSATTTNPVSSGTNVTAVDVRNKQLVWVGTSSGRIFVTENGGNTWREKTFPSNATGSVGDIRFVNDYAGYFVHTAGGAARLFSTYTGGYYFSNVAPRILNLPASVGLNRIAFPQCADTDVALANVIVAGLGATSDGLLLKGSSPEV